MLSFLPPDSLLTALQSTDPDSLYSDLVRFLLTAIFSLQDEEDEDENIEDNKAKIEGLKTDASFKQLVEQATAAALVPTQTFGENRLMENIVY